MRASGDREAEVLGCPGDRRPREEAIGEHEQESGSFAPVEGISLRRYARVAVELHRVTPEQMEATAEAHGIPKGRLQAIAEEWNRRMQADPQVVQRYSELYQEGMREAGIEAPDISLEQYADILVKSKTAPLQEVLSEFGLTIQTFALVSGQMGERLQADPSLAAKLGEILGGKAGQ